MANQNFGTLEVVKELLATQQQAFRLLVTDIKDSVKEVKKDFEELKRSLEFSQKDLRDTDIKVTNLESKVEQVRMKARDQEGFMDYVEDQMEYMENQSRRNNVKILGLREDKEKETSWEETEKIVKNVIRNQLQIKEDIHIERAHRVGKPRPLGSHDDASDNDDADRPKLTRPIIAKFTFWKQKEKVLRAARQKKPKDIRLFPDFAKRTLDRRAEKIPELIEQRKKGKIAYLVMDKIVVKDRPPDFKRQNSDNEVFVNVGRERK